MYGFLMILYPAMPAMSCYLQKIMWEPCNQTSLIMIRSQLPFLSMFRLVIMF